MTVGGIGPFPVVLSRAIRRPRRGTIIATLIGVVAIGLLATGVTIFLRLDAQLPFAHYDIRVMSVAIAQLDGRTVVVSGGDDGMVRVWDLATSDPIGHPLDGHSGSSVNAVATAQLNGRTVIISGSDDGTVRVWDLASVRP